MTSEFAIAVHTLVYLNHKADCMSSGMIAENVCCNPARIRKILAKLKKKDLIRTREGADGGCMFFKDPQEVNLRMICEAVEELPVHVSKSTGSLDMDCQIASGMAGVMEDIYGILNRRVYQELEKITVADIDAKIFGKEKGR